MHDLFFLVTSLTSERRAKDCCSCSPPLPKGKKGGGEENCSKFQGGKMKPKASKASHPVTEKEREK